MQNFSCHHFLKKYPKLENLKLYFWFTVSGLKKYKCSWFKHIPTENIDKSIDWSANNHFVVFT